MSASEVQSRTLKLGDTSALYAKALTFGLSFYVFAMATSMSLMEIGAGLLFVLYLFSPYPHLSFKKVPLALPIVCFLLVVLAGIASGDSALKDKLYDLGRTRFFLVYFILFFLLKNRETESPHSYEWLKVLRSILWVVGIYGFVQHFVALDLIRPEGKKVLLYALQDEKIGPLVLGTFNHHLTFANSYLFFACLFLSLGLVSPKKAWYDLALGAFLFLLIFWTQSRIAWVAIPFCLVTMAVCHYGKRALLISMVGSLLFVTTVYLVSPSFQERFSKTFETTDARSFVPRLNLWKTQIEMFKDHPLLGMGWNNNERHSKEYLDRIPVGAYPHQYGHAHSMPLQILATTGAFGLFFFLWIWAGLFRLSLNAVRVQSGFKKGLAIGAFASFVGFWIQGLTQWNFGDAEVVYTLIFFWALAANLSKPPSATRDQPSALV